MPGSPRAGRITPHSAIEVISSTAESGDRGKNGHIISLLCYSSV